MRVFAGKTGRLRRIAALLLCLVMAAALLPTATAQAQQPQGKTVRVGWFDSAYNTVDQFGRRSGYAYEYQIKIAAYTGWTYEYVTGSWSDLLQMLIDGEIDLMSDVSYTDERAELMLYPDLPMGAEEYYIFTSPNNQTISSSDYSTLNGKKVAVNRNSFQAELYREWAERHGIEAELLEINYTEDESLRMLQSGAFDAYVTVDSFVHPGVAVPVGKVGSSYFYFAVNKERPDLLAELDAALNRIQDENRFYNEQLFERYIKTKGANAFLSGDELDWLNAHGTIRLGYQDNYLAFCAQDPATGELTGAMKDYLAYAETCLENAQLSFEPVAYPSIEAALQALARGEVDCIFPANFSGYDGEREGIFMTPALMRTDVYAIIRQSDQTTFNAKAHVIVAVNQGNPNYDDFLLDSYPDWRKVYYATTADCLHAVSEHVADCVLISSYRYNNISRLCEKYNLTTFPTGESLDYCFAVAKDHTQLYSILSRVVSLVPTSTVNSALSYYITEDARISLRDFLEDNLAAVLLIAGILVLLILALLLRSLHAERLSKKLITATEIDGLTGLYNRDYFFQYAERMRHEHRDRAMDAIVMNIEQFHAVNAVSGRDFGDRVLRALGEEIAAIAKENGGIAGRFGADRFDIYCRHTERLNEIFDRLQSKLGSLSPNASIRLRMGVMPWQPDIEPVQQFDRARTACSMARGNYKEHLIVYDERLRERELMDQHLLNDLRRALDNYEFEVHYQPKYNIQVEPPVMVSAEALVRWKHPEYGMIAPNNFIPLLERSGQIGEVDKYVWFQAARQVARWRAEFGMTLPVSVNLSRVDVFDPALESTLDSILLQNGLEPAALKLEVTESAYTDNAEQLIQVVERLRARGYTVEMDDFGTGYSSLNMLSAMPVDVLKMDRIFIRNIDHDEKDVHMVSLILNIARSLDIPVVAEGVETEEQLKLLKKLGCLVVQGYYFSRPLHPAEFEAQFLGGKEENKEGSQEERKEGSQEGSKEGK